MITTMRSTLKGPVFRVILSIAILALLAAMVIPALIDRTGQQTKQWVYNVDGTSVSAQKYYKTIQMLQHQKSTAYKNLVAQYGEDIAAQLMRLYGLEFDPVQQAERSLVSSELLGNLADKLAIDVPTDVVMQHAVSQLPPEIIDEDGNIDVQRLQQLLPAMSLDEFEADVKKQLRNSQLLDLVSVGAYVPEFAVKNAYMQQYASKNYGVVFFPESTYLAQAKKTPVTSEQLKSFFASQNKATKRYWLPEKRTVTVWKFSPEGYGIKVTDAEVEKYYNTNKRQEFVDQPVEIQVHRIVIPVDEKNVHKSRVEAATTLEAVKKDPASFKAKAKESTWVGRQNPDDVLEQKLFALKNDGDISEVIQTKDGFEIYQRAEKKSQTYKSLASVKKDIREKLMNNKFAALFGKSARRAVSTYRDGDDAALVNFAKAHQAKAETKVVTRSDNTMVANQAFGIKKAQGAVTFFDAKDGIIEKLDKIEARKEPSLDSVKAQVEKDWYAAQAQTGMKKAMEKASELAKKEPLSKVASALGVQFKTSGLVNAENEDKLKKLQSEKFPVDVMIGMHEKGAIRDAVTPEMGYLIKLFEIEPFDQKAYEAKKLKLAGALRQQQDNLLKEGFIASLLQNATIKVNNSLKTQ